MTDKILEEIFWKDGKFVKENGEEVKANPIGKPWITKVHESEPDFLKKRVYGFSLRKDLYPQKPNAFSRGELPVGIFDDNNLIYPIQLYKI